MDAGGRVGGQPLQVEEAQVAQPQAVGRQRRQIPDQGPLRGGRRGRGEDLQPAGGEIPAGQELPAGAAPLGIRAAAAGEHPGQLGRQPDDGGVLDGHCGEAAQQRDGLGAGREESLQRRLQHPAQAVGGAVVEPLVEGLFAEIEILDDLLDGGLGVVQPVEDNGLDEGGPVSFRWRRIMPESLAARSASVVKSVCRASANRSSVMVIENSLGTDNLYNCIVPKEFVLNLFRMGAPPVALPGDHEIIDRTLPDANQAVVRPVAMYLESGDQAHCSRMAMCASERAERPSVGDRPEPGRQIHTGGEQHRIVGAECKPPHEVRMAQVRRGLPGICRIEFRTVVATRDEPVAIG